MYCLFRRGEAARAEALEGRLLLATFAVTTTVDAGAGSLRAAINTANASPGADTIAFAIASGLRTIVPATPLPEVIGPTVIDATTQPGYRGTPLIQLDGAVAGAASPGLHLRGADCTVRGFTLVRWEAGVLLEGGRGVVEGCYVGLTAFGTVAGNVTGVHVVSASNRVGGPAAAQRNVISGNGGDGVWIVGEAAANNLVQGNFIGTDLAGAVAVGNGLAGRPQGFGVFVENAPGTVVGGAAEGQGNVISGNRRGGVSLSGAGSRVQGNFIGTDRAGLAALGNGTIGDGIDVEMESTLIGGDTPAARNVVSGNYRGIYVTGADGEISGNYVGLGADGLRPLPNVSHGIEINEGFRVRVGGTTPGSRNVVSSNGGSGIMLDYSVRAVILNTFVGLSADGLLGRGNTRSGIEARNAEQTVIGGLPPDHPPGPPAPVNVIAANGGHGIDVYQPVGATIVQNVIGANAAGSAMGNGGSGVHVVGGPAPTAVGDARPGDGNTIANNRGDGVTVLPGGPVSILGNSIDDNGGLGIDLGGDGVTPNDPVPDADTGANGLQNFPVLTGTARGAGGTVVNGVLRSRPGATYFIDFYASPAADPGGAGEGRVYVASTSVTTDAAGEAAFGPTLDGVEGWFVTATATAATGETSEFSPAVPTPRLPRVASAAVASGGWSGAFLNHLRATGLGSIEHGYVLPSDNTGRPPVVPWANLDRVSLAFEDDGGAAARRQDLRVTGAGGGDYAVSGFEYHAPTRTATWTLARPLGNDRVTLDLDMDGDGDAGGEAAGDWRFAFGALAGDSTREGTVNALDLADAKRRLGRSTTNLGTGGGAYSLFADATGDGRINALDLALVKRQLGSRLPATA